MGILSAVKASPHVVRFYGVCVDAPDGRVRIVLERCAHGSLRDYIRGLEAAQVRAGVPCIPSTGHRDDIVI